MYVFCLFFFSAPNLINFFDDSRRRSYTRSTADAASTQAAKTAAAAGRRHTAAIQHDDNAGRCQRFAHRKNARLHLMRLLFAAATKMEIGGAGGQQHLTPLQQQQLSAHQHAMMMGGGVDPQMAAAAAAAQQQQQRMWAPNGATDAHGRPFYPQMAGGQAQGAKTRACSLSLLYARILGYAGHNPAVSHPSVLETLITNGPTYGTSMSVAGKRRQRRRLLQIDAPMFLVAGGSADYEPAPPALAEALKASNEDEVRLHTYNLRNTNQICRRDTWRKSALFDNTSTFCGVALVTASIKHRAIICNLQSRCSIWKGAF